MDEIRQENANTKSNSYIHGDQNNSYQENKAEYIPQMQNGNVRSGKKSDSQFTKRIKRGAGVALVFGILAMAIYMMNSTSTSVNKGEDAKMALETHVSTTLGAGTRLLDKDDNYIGGDLTITHNSNKEDTTLYVWDYAAEDGDYVEVFVDGVSLGEPFMIKNKPVSFIVPAECEVTVVGTRDGGGGITYGVYYEVDQTTYFNGMNQGGDNTYTLIRGE